LFPRRTIQPNLVEHFLSHCKQGHIKEMTKKIVERENVLLDKKIVERENVLLD
jgi:hypothetical protein